jgi:FixJ family two-component response regulator
MITPVHGFVRAGVAYIDDSAMALQSMRRALYTHGLLLETYSSFRDFLSRDDQPLRAVLLDMDLGSEQTGFDLAVHVRTKHPHCPIAFLTSETNAESLARATEWGCVFTKDKDLNAAVQWLLSHAGIQSSEPMGNLG